MTTVVNLYSGPGAGKSTTAAHLFALLKHQGINAELVTEYAKGQVWEGRSSVFGNQLYMLGKQHHSIWRCLGKVDVVVTDSPILLSVYYGKGMTDTFRNLVVEEYRKMTNVDVMLQRVKPYQPKGRMQTEGEAKDIDGELRKILDDERIKYNSVVADEEAAHKILSLLKLKGVLNAP